MYYTALEYEQDRDIKIINQRRKLLGITQKELSEIIELGLRTLIDIESGKSNPSIEQLQKVVSALGLSISVKVKHNE